MLCCVALRCVRMGIFKCLVVFFIIKLKIIETPYPLFEISWSLRIEFVSSLLFVTEQMPIFKSHLCLCRTHSKIYVNVVIVIRFAVIMSLFNKCWCFANSFWIALKLAIYNQKQRALYTLLRCWQIPNKVCYLLFRLFSRHTQIVRVCATLRTCSCHTKIHSIHLYRPNIQFANSFRNCISKRQKCWLLSSIVFHTILAKILNKM